MEKQNMLEFVRRCFWSKVFRWRYHIFSSRGIVSLCDWQKLVGRTAKRLGEDSLLSINRPCGEIGYSGEHNSEISEVFADVELGTWAINSRTMDLLWRYLDEKRPKVVLEFGSGSSTCVFATWFKNNYEEGRVISIDQNEWAAKETRERLERFGLSDGVNMLIMPLDENDQYKIDITEIKNVLDGRSIDVVFVDGPAGCTGCRKNILPSVLSCLSDAAIWFLHDALRDGEMSICSDWEQISGVSVCGIVPFGNGIAVGTWNKCM